MHVQQRRPLLHTSETSSMVLWDSWCCESGRCQSENGYFTTPGPHCTASSEQQATSIQTPEHQDASKSTCLPYRTPPAGSRPLLLTLQLLPYGVTEAAVYCNTKLNFRRKHQLQAALASHKGNRTNRSPRVREEEDVLRPLERLSTLN